MQTVDPKIPSNEPMLFFIANSLIVTTPILIKFPFFHLSWIQQTVIKRAWQRCDA
jgi:hypothetical protein